MHVNRKKRNRHLDNPDEAFVHKALLVRLVFLATLAQGFQFFQDLCIFFLVKLKVNVVYEDFGKDTLEILVQKLAKAVFYGRFSYGKDQFPAFNVVDFYALNVDSAENRR